MVAWFQDTGVSGATELEDREGLQRALGALRSHRAGVLVVAKRDRLARDVVVAALVERAVTAAGALVRSADGAGEAAGPEGVLLRGVTDLFAAYERLVIAARTKAALAAKRGSGYRAGAVPWGYAAQQDGRLIEHPDEQRVLQRIRELRERGLAFRAIVVQLREEGFRTRGGKALGVSRVLGLSRRAMQPDQRSR